MNASTADVGAIKRWPQRAAGFSLVELLMTMSLSAGLMTLAAPFLGAILESNRVQTAASAFLGPLYLARSEAIKRNARVVLCRSTTGTSCAPSGGWDKGYIMFVDLNDNVQVDGDETILLRGDPLPGSLRLSGNPGVVGYVAYVGTGATQQTSGAFQAGTFTLCSVNSSVGRKIVISSTGRARIQKSTEATCN